MARRWLASRPVNVGLLLLLVSALAVLLAPLPLAAMLARLANLPAWQLLLWCSLNLVLIGLANLRWWLLLRRLASFRFLSLLMIRQAGQLVNMLTPGPHLGGEPLQLYWLARRQLALGKALVALGLDRLLEVVVNLSVLLLGLVLLLDSRFSQLAGSALASKSSLLLLLVLVPLAWRYRRWPLARLAQMLASWRAHPRLAAYLQPADTGLVAQGKALLADTRLLALGIGISLAAWGLLLAELALLLAMVDIRLGVDEFVLLAVALRLAQLVPVPAGLGALEAAVFGAGSLLQIPAEAALGLLVLMRCRDLALVLVGLVCLQRVQRLPIAEIASATLETSCDTPPSRSRSPIASP